jgi:diguanylate cyclase (GGDEF)-like protein
VRDASGQAVRAVGFVVDITDARRGELALRAANRALEEERRSLARQTLEDPLTGIANRRYLDGELARICAGAEERADAVCVGMADVDCFKAYNDRYGHLGGDTALRQIASALQSVAGPRDVVARYGGEEFVFVLRDVRDPAPILQRFVDAVAALAIPHSDSPTGYLTVSCGCVIVSEGGKLTPAALLEASDEALYDAKSAGRNGYVIQALDAAAVRLNVSPRFDAR